MKKIAVKKIIERYCKLLYNTKMTTRRSLRVFVTEPSLIEQRITSLPTFNSPSDIAVAPNGDIFVADGHGDNGNNRVVKFSKDGKFIKEWGKAGWAPRDFHTLHAIAIDSRGRVFVGDRGNNRIQIFDSASTFER